MLYPHNNRIDTIHDSYDTENISHPNTVCMPLSLRLTSTRSQMFEQGPDSNLMLPPSPRPSRSIPIHEDQMQFFFQNDDIIFCE